MIMAKKTFKLTDVLIFKIDTWYKLSKCLRRCVHCALGLKRIVNLLSGYPDANIYRYPPDSDIIKLVLQAICDWLCENPPCSRANFDLILEL